MAQVDYESAPKTSGDGVREAAGGAVRETAGTAMEQAKQVGAETKTQMRDLAQNARQRIGEQARSQNDRLADTVRRFADELDEMAGERGDSPAAKVVTQVSQGGRRVADYLAEHGPDGLLAEVQDFARRRPGAFLAVAATAGFVVGRLGKGVLSAGSSESTTQPATTPTPMSTTPPATPPTTVTTTPPATVVATAPVGQERISTTAPAGTAPPVVTPESVRP